MHRLSRERAQAAARVGGLVFVVLWLFSPRLQDAIPFWLPFVVLAAAELELLIRGIRERREGPQPRSADRRLPGSDDADLGWVATEDEEGNPLFLPAPLANDGAREDRSLVVLLVGIGLFVYAYRVDRQAGWPAVPAAAQAKAERRFSAEAARIAGKAVSVRCDDGYAYTGVGSDAAGVAFIPRGLAFLEPSICRSLYRIAFEKKLGARDDAAFAITVLAHEATHLRGVSNEAETECYALQEGVGLGERLGLSTATAHDLMRSQLARDLSDASIARLDYRLPPGCRDGGSLDLRPADSTFP